MLPLRLRRVPGYEGRLNDTLFQPAAARAPHHHTLVFFPGDVQDYPEVMAAHRDNRQYQHWNLESTARLLARSFPHQHILVVRPSRVELKSFSCFDNFVPSNNAGVPDHAPTHQALRHLERLLQGVSARLKQMPEAELLRAVCAAPPPEDIDIEDLDVKGASRRGPGSANGAQGSATGAQGSAGGAQGSANGAKGSANGAQGSAGPAPLVPERDPLWWREALSLERSHLTLVGFSKGCVVLNQLIYEFHYTQTLTPGDTHTLRFMERVCSMYWLDGGHAGGKNTWLTARSLLETLARLGVNIYIHVSPYQVQDEARPWIGREEKAFTALLKKLGAKVSRYLHDDGAAPYSLDTHFNVLANFKSVQDAAPPPACDDT